MHLADTFIQSDLHCLKPIKKIRHLYYSPLSLSDCSSTRIFKLTHTYRNIWTTANQRGVRTSLSLIGLDHDMGLMCVCCWTTGRLSELWSLFFFFFWTAGRTGATSDFFLSHHWEIRSHSRTLQSFCAFFRHAYHNKPVLLNVFINVIYHWKWENSSFNVVCVT